jgi:aspartyl-tRNA(Asn)/glutamyl-tRNA(Gln) amidotransferase subunit B
VPVEPPREMIDAARSEVGELPGARIRRLEQEVGFDLAEGLVMSARDRLYERVPGNRRGVANVLMNQFAATGIDPAAVNADELGKLIEARTTIPRATFMQALAESGNGEFTADKYLAEAAITDTAELEPILERVLAANESQVASYKAGKEGVLGYLVGQVMKETQGKANPKIVNELLREKLKH